MSDKEEEPCSPAQDIVIPVTSPDDDVTKNIPHGKPPNKCVSLHDLLPSNFKERHEYDSAAVNKSISSIENRDEAYRLKNLETTGINFLPPLDASDNSVVGLPSWFQDNTKDIEHERKNNSIWEKYRFLSRTALIIVCGLILAVATTMESCHLSSSSKEEKNSLFDNPNNESYSWGYSEVNGDEYYGDTANEDSQMSNTPFLRLSEDSQSSNTSSLKPITAHIFSTEGEKTSLFDIPNNETDTQGDEGEDYYGDITDENSQPSNNLLKPNPVPIILYDAIIVGSGWAGLKAAETLLASRFSSILLLEANDYIGGRCKTNNDLIPNVPVDLGGEWLYTSGSNMAGVSLHDLDLDFTPPARFSEFPVVFLESVRNGVTVTERLDTSKTASDYNRLWSGKNGFLQFAKRLSKKLRGEDIDNSFGDAATDFENTNSLQNGDQQILNMWIDTEIETNFAAEETDLSLADTNYDGTIKNMRYLSVPGAGYGNAAKSFAEPFKSKIKLNAKVTEINYEDDDNVLVSYVENGVVRHAKAHTTLVTVPLGVLKAGIIKFTPNLPEDKQDVINNMGFGSLNKCIMYWEHPEDVVWPKDKEWIYLATPDDESSGIWTNFMNALDTKGVPVLQSFIGGDESISIEEQTDAEVIADVMKNLLAMFPTITSPDKVIVTRWGKDESFGGAYSFETVGRKFVADAEILGERTGSIWFAGEATNVEGLHGTAIGAWNTGEMAATSMVSDLKRQRY